MTQEEREIITKFIKEKEKALLHPKNEHEKYFIKGEIIGAERVLSRLEEAEQEPCEDCKRVDRFIEKEGVVISQLRADRDRLLEGYEKLKSEIADVLQTIEQIKNTD